VRSKKKGRAQREERGKREGEGDREETEENWGVSLPLTW
jgi:hypothetical protein